MNETLYVYRTPANTRQVEWAGNLHYAPVVSAEQFDASWCFDLRDDWWLPDYDDDGAHRDRCTYLVRVPDERLVEWIVLMDSGLLGENDFRVAEEWDTRDKWYGYRKNSWLRWNLYGSHFYRVESQLYGVEPVQYLKFRRNKIRMQEMSSSSHTRYERIDILTWLLNTSEPPTPQSEECPRSIIFNGITTCII